MTKSDKSIFKPLFEENKMQWYKMISRNSEYDKLIVTGILKKQFGEVHITSSENFIYIQTDKIEIIDILVDHNLMFEQANLK